MSYLYLAIAIVAEVTATTALKASDAFKKPFPSLVVLLGYGTAFYSLALCLRHFSVGGAYAIWSGLGIVLVTFAAALLYNQIPDAWAIVGMTLIVAGVLILNLLSNSTVHLVTAPCSQSQGGAETRLSAENARGSRSNHK
jgi:small multidrug resistance pump